MSKKFAGKMCQPFLNNFESNGAFFKSYKKLTSLRSSVNGSFNLCTPVDRLIAKTKD